jgi:hypothetical protein
MAELLAARQVASMRLLMALETTSAIAEVEHLRELLGTGLRRRTGQREAGVLFAALRVIERQHYFGLES